MSVATTDPSGFICPAIAAVCIGLVVLSRLIAYAKVKARRNAVYARYGHGQIAENILSQTVWEGETSEQLEMSLGKPVDIDQKVLKSKVKEVWKYGQRGRNRFAYRVTLENGIVVGWEAKS